MHAPALPFHSVPQTQGELIQITTEGGRSGSLGQRRCSESRTRNRKVLLLSLKYCFKVLRRGEGQLIQGILLPNSRTSTSLAARVAGLQLAEEEQ